jgi:hypothetical protein
MFFQSWADMKLPSNGIKIRNFNGSKLPQKVKVNGRDISGFNEKEIERISCKVEIY